MAEQQNCCQWCVSFIFSLGFTALFMWLSLRPSEPTYSIEKFYVTALNRSAAVQDPTTINTTITFDFKLSNPNKDSRIYYDTLNITVYYGHNLTLLPIGNVSIPGYRQGRKKKATKPQNLTAVGVPWKTAIEEVSTGKNITVFRVNLETTIRYKTLFVMSKRRQMKVGGNVTVDNSGFQTGKKKKGVVKLSSANSVHRSDCVRVGFLLLFVWIFLL